MSRVNGTVKFFNHARGFGFIQPDDGGKDVFVHASALERSGVPALNEGDKVSFEIEDDRRGRGKQEEDGKDSHRGSAGGRGIHCFRHPDSEQPWTTHALTPAEIAPPASPAPRAMDVTYQVTLLNRRARLRAAGR